MGTLLKATLFTVALVALFVWAGEVVTKASGGAQAAVLGEGVSVEIGEQVFWGPGKCHTCHALGTRGSRVRCPNLGDSSEGQAIGIRAIERADERTADLGRDMSATEYLVESIAAPSAHVVEGYKDEMPKVFEPPISLTPDQVSSVILYLQAQGGTPDAGAIVLPAEIREAAARGGDTEPWEPYLDGDSIRGRELFFDAEGPAPCAKCHLVEERGGDVGPELTSIAGTRTAAFIVEAILEPSVEIASGYESILIETTAGQIIDGVLRGENADSVSLATSDGEVITLATSDIARQRMQDVSLMPDNFAELLSVTQLHDLLAYLRTLE
ncbi:MAG: hypothetical protein ACE5FP_08050 [Gemmatimonadota bacterium]